MLAARTTKRIAFLLGFGFAFLPSLGPFAAVLFILTARLRVRRTDVPWFASALVSAGVLAAHRGLSGAIFGLLQVLGPWAVYRAFAELRHPYFDRLPKRVVLQGLFVGFVFVVAFGFSSVRLNLSYPTITQAITWGGNPALFAHMVLVVGSLIALLATDGWLRVAALSLSGVGVLAAGSRESAYGLLLVLAYLLVRSVRRRKGREATAFIILGSVFVMLLGFGQMVGIGRIGFLVAPASATPGSNLVRGSELPSGDWWDTRNVAVQTSRAAIKDTR